MASDTLMNQHQSSNPHPQDTSLDSSSTSNDISSSSGSSCASTHPQISISEDLKLVIELLGNCNTMITMNATSLEDIKKRHADSFTNTNKKIDILLSHVKDLEDRLNDIDQKKKASKQIIKLEEEQVKISATTEDAFDKIGKRLKSLTGRVSSIEHLCVIRSNYNKKRRVSQE